MTTPNWTEVVKHVLQRTMNAPFYGSDSERVLAYINKLERHWEHARATATCYEKAYEGAHAELTAFKRTDGGHWQRQAAGTGGRIGRTGRRNPSEARLMNANTVGVCLIAMGMLGLWAHVDYSGWVLFFGILALL